MIKENGKYKKFDARIFANSGDMIAYDKNLLGMLDPIANDKIAIHLNAYHQTGFRFTSLFKTEPTFKNGHLWWATHVISSDIDMAHRDRMDANMETMQENTGDISVPLRNYCEGYFYVTKLRGEDAAGIERDDFRESFYNRAHYMMEWAEMFVGEPGIISDLDKGLAESCEHLRTIGILKPLHAPKNLHL